MSNRPLFEVPYNFSLALLPYYKRNMERINFLFLPPYREDSINTRSSIETAKRGRCYMPTTRAEYEHHLQSIVSSGLRYVVLWQSDNVISEQILNYYCNLGASGFIIANDCNAKIIKDFNPSLLVVASLVQRLCSGITQRDFHYYDYVLLYYPFNRSLEGLKRLSFIKDKLVLMPNTFCHVNCPSMHHWFPSKEKSFNPKRDCMALRDSDSYAVHSGLISPDHLYLFDQYVSGYKLEGREYSTKVIKFLCDSYFNRNSGKEMMETMLGNDIAKGIINEMDSMPLEDYYNRKTTDILDVL